MKKILLALVVILALCSSSILKAQDFTMLDTVICTITPADTAFHNNITNITSSPLTLKWHVVSTNFPADWLAGGAFGICDNNVCYANDGGDLWNGTSGSMHTTLPYLVDSAGNFDYAPDLLETTITSTGCYYVNVNIADLSYNKTVTFIVCRTPSLATSNISSVTNDVLLYPNPANNELNVVFDATADVKNIAVYNIIGKVMTVYKVTGGSANLNIENVPSGIYFVRLYNGVGNVVATRKFTKQ